MTYVDCDSHILPEDAFADLPMRPVKPNTAAMDSLFESLDAGVDPIDAILELEGIE